MPDDKLGELHAGDNLGDDYRASFRTACDRADARVRAAGDAGEDRRAAVRRDARGHRARHRDLRRDHAHLDLAKATGQSTELDPDVLDAAWALAPMMLTDEYRAAGIFGPVVEVDEDAPVQDKLAAFAGRTP